jgi:hypothetical protein
MAGEDGSRPELSPDSQPPRALESTPIVTALYLDALLLRKDTDRARLVFQGLVKLARVSGVPGLLARGIYAGGKRYYGDPSVLDYAAWHYAIWRYFESPQATAAEKDEIRHLVAASLSRLEEHRFIICDEEGEATSFHELAYPGPMQAEHLLAILLTGHRITGNPHWLNVYHQRLPKRLNLLRHYGVAAIPLASTCPQNAWTMHRALLSLTALVTLDNGEKTKAAFAQGMRGPVTIAAAQAADFREYLGWRKGRADAGRLVKGPVAHPIMIPLAPSHAVIAYWHNRGNPPALETAGPQRKVWYSAEAYAAVMLAGDPSQAQQAAQAGRELLDQVDFQEFRDVRPLVAALCGYWRGKARGESVGGNR